jgi:hypothetical protein
MSQRPAGNILSSTPGLSPRRPGPAFQLGASTKVLSIPSSNCLASTLLISSSRRKREGM